MGPQEHPEWCDTTRSGHQNTQSTFFSKNDQNAPGQPRVTKGQVRSKSTQNNTFHSFIPNSSFLEIFGNFDLVDPKLTPSGP